MLAPAGASGSRIDSRMLNNFQSNFHTEQNKGPMVCLEGEEKKDSVFGSILCCYSGGNKQEVYWMLLYITHVIFMERRSSTL